MSIQALASASSGIARLSAQRTNGTATFSSLARQAAASTSVNPGGTVVSLSPEARRLGETRLPGWVQEYGEKLRANPDQDEAMGFVETMTTLPSLGGALVSVPDEYGRSYYSYTGELVTPENWQRYVELGVNSSMKTAEIFRTEKAKGSSAAEIFEATQQYMATLPDDYLRVLDWFRPTSAHGG